MTDLSDFRNLKPKEEGVVYSAEHVSSGIPVPKTRRIELLSPDEWEEFTEEWASSLEEEYQRVQRFAGSGDQGLDVVGFISDHTFSGGWDNYQCKHYSRPLYPSDVWVEIGKIIYYSYSGEYPQPRKHYFVAPREVGTKLAKLLASPKKLKAETMKNWPDHCEKCISSTIIIPLEGDLLDYCDNFDFSIFSSKTRIELIYGHSKTNFHTVRFGGGLPARPVPDQPPKRIASAESRYIEQIFEAYTDSIGATIRMASELSGHEDLQRDFLRQRERFYHAESLRNFSRDNVPEGTFEELQEDIFQGVVDICESDHEHGLRRMRETMAQSAQVPATSSPLSTALKTQDKQGICHQLANEDRLIWVKETKDD